MPHVLSLRSNNSFTEEVSISKHSLTLDILRFYEERLSKEQQRVERKDKRTHEYSSKE